MPDNECLVLFSRARVGFTERFLMPGGGSNDDSSNQLCGYADAFQTRSSRRIAQVW